LLNVALIGQYLQFLTLVMFGNGMIICDFFLLFDSTYSRVLRPIWSASAFNSVQ